MSKPATPPSQQSAGDERNLVTVDEQSAQSIEDWLQVFWRKNGRAVLGLFGLVILGIIVKGGWEQLAAHRDLEVRDSYAVAKKPAELKAFAAEHPDHPLAGIALLRTADEAYAAGKSSEAAGAYDEVLAAIADGPLRPRVRLGLALAQIQGDLEADGMAGLKKLAAEESLSRAIRAEALYHLASLAAEAKDVPELQKLSDQLLRVDPSSPWTQRAFALRSSLPVESSPAAPPEAPADVPAADAAAPSIQFKLPGK
jgi:hypothetical protein